MQDKLIASFFFFVLLFFVKCKKEISCNLILLRWVWCKFGGLSFLLYMTNAYIQYCWYQTTINFRFLFQITFGIFPKKNSNHIVHTSINIRLVIIMKNVQRAFILKFISLKAIKIYDVTNQLILNIYVKHVHHQFGCDI